MMECPAQRSGKVKVNLDYGVEYDDEGNDEDTDGEATKRRWEIGKECRK